MNRKNQNSIIDRCNKRLVYIDMVRGFGMISIVAGHMGASIIADFVFTYHVPIFFIISGILFANRKEILKKYFFRLIKPYIISWLLLILLSTLKQIAKVILKRGTCSDILISSRYWFIAGLYGAGSKSKNAFLFLKNIPSIGAIWFFLALFWAVLFLFLIEKIELKQRYESFIVRTIVVFLIFIFGWKSADYTWFPLSIQSGCCGLIFLYIGFLIKPFFLNFSVNVRMAKKKGFIFLSLFSCLFFWIITLENAFKNIYDTSQSLVRCHFTNPIIDVAGAVGASVLFLLIARQAEKAQFDKCRFGRLLILYGVYSDIILCIHTIDMSLFSIDWRAFNVPGVAFAALLFGKLIAYYIIVKIILNIKKRKCING